MSDPQDLAIPALNERGEPVAHARASHAAGRANYQDSPMGGCAADREGVHMSEYRNVTRTVTLLLEDVTEETEREFFRRLVGHEIGLLLSDGMEYIASVESVASR